MGNHPQIETIENNKLVSTANSVRAFDQGGGDPCKNS